MGLPGLVEFGTRRQGKNDIYFKRLNRNDEF